VKPYCGSPPASADEHGHAACRIEATCLVNLREKLDKTTVLTPALSSKEKEREKTFTVPLKIRVINKAASPALAEEAAGIWMGKFYAAVACALACGAGVVAGRCHNRWRAESV
jgi:hypothetical protein